jgi:multimeric flavodoxin WrbA
MKATVLLGTNSHFATDRVAAFSRQLAEKGWSVETYHLTETTIPPCGGDFDCWLKTPGKCRMNGPHQEILTSIAQSGLLMLVTPVMWGGYGYDLKKFMDHIIPFITPLMEKHKGETHHVRRYSRPPDILAVGLLDRRDSVLEGLFEAVVKRNVLNLQCERYDVRFLCPESFEHDTGAPTGSWFPLRYESRSMNLPDLTSYMAAPPELPARPPRKALFLTGSPNGWKGHSGVLGRYVAEKLKGRGTDVTFASAYGSFNSEQRTRELIGVAASADLLFLTTPLYVDQLPAPVIRILERLGDHFSLTPGMEAPRLAVLVNSGFPEPTHNETALAIYRQFAIACGCEWAGGLSIPGGGMLDGESIEALGGRVHTLRIALDLVADALARGVVIPAEAVTRARKLTIPLWLYRLIANIGFRWAGRGRSLKARPDRV